MVTVTQDNIESIMSNVLGKKLYVVLTRGIKPAEEIRKFRVAHIQHQMDLEERGILFAAGPLADAVSGQKQRLGLIVIRAENEAEARKIADSDPMHANGMRQYELFQWSINEGGFNLRIRYSNQSYDFD